MRLRRGQDYIGKKDRQMGIWKFWISCWVLPDLVLLALLITVILDWPTAKKSTQGRKPVLLLWFKASYIRTAGVWSNLFNSLTVRLMYLYVKSKERNRWHWEQSLFLPGYLSTMVILGDHIHWNSCALLNRMLHVSGCHCGLSVRLVRWPGEEWTHWKGTTSYRISSLNRFVV